MCSQQSAIGIVEPIIEVKTHDLGKAAVLFGSNLVRRKPTKLVELFSDPLYGLVHSVLPRPCQAVPPRASRTNGVVLAIEAVDQKPFDAREKRAVEQRQIDQLPLSTLGRHL